MVQGTENHQLYTTYFTYAYALKKSAAYISSVDCTQKEKLEPVQSFPLVYSFFSTSSTEWFTRFKVWFFS